MTTIRPATTEDQTALGILAETAGYAQEGRVRDFYADGEDKVIYRKRIGGCA